MNISRRNFLWWISGTLATASLFAAVGCALKEDFVPPGDSAETMNGKQLPENIDLEQVEQTYKEIMDVQLQYYNQINNVEIPETEKINACFRQGDYLFKENKMDLDSSTFLEVQEEICKTIKAAQPEAPEALLKLAEAKEFQGDNLQQLMEDIALLNKKELQEYISAQKLDQRTGLKSEVISFILYMSLTPFYSVYTEKVSEASDDFSIWRQGYCPVCGQTAVIARHRVEDEARILFCWLCHAEWVFPRLECPYCDNNNARTLRYFYVDDNRSHQVHVCQKCNYYLKTVVGKTFEQEQLLKMEDIETRYLDMLAEQEGFKRPI